MNKVKVFWHILNISYEKKIFRVYSDTNNKWKKKQIMSQPYESWGLFQFWS